MVKQWRYICPVKLIKQTKTFPMDFMQITIDQFKKSLSAHMADHGTESRLPHERGDSYHYNQACALGTLLELFGMTKQQIDAIAAEIRQTVKS